MKWNPIKDIQKGLKKLKKEIGKPMNFNAIAPDFAAFGKGLESAGQGLMRDLGNVASGNFNNLGQSLLSSTLRVGTLGAVSEREAKNIIGETGGQRAEREGKEAETAAVMAGIKAEEDERNKMVSSFLQSVVNQKSRAPGRMQTLLGNPGASQNTLLTLR
jgi:hypothetical protein